MALASGSRLGPYEIVALLGAGGMGEVYKARDTRPDRTVAIKVIAAAAGADLATRQRFKREARAISALSHPHICVLYDIGEHEGAEFLVMEHLEGETLAERLHRGPVALDEAIRFAAQLADALSAAHQHGIIHHDLKPGNVMLTRAGAKLLDFGLAHLSAGATADAVTMFASHSSAAGAAIGTAAYMSPEQARGETVDARSDVFSLGAVLYELFTGARAFPGSTTAIVFDAILNRQAQPPSRVNPALPLPLDGVVQRAIRPRVAAAGDGGRTTCPGAGSYPRGNSRIRRHRQAVDRMGLERRRCVIDPRAGAQPATRRRAAVPRERAVLEPTVGRGVPRSRARDGERTAFSARRNYRGTSLVLAASVRSLARLS